MVEHISRLKGRDPDSHSRPCLGRQKRQMAKVPGTGTENPYPILPNPALPARSPELAITSSALFRNPRYYYRPITEKNI